MGEQVEIAVRFPFGRYHATAWGRHHNEGAVDWPPSPWRLLRAIYATWANRCPDVDERRFTEALSKLGEPPRYSVPAFSLGCTRHYLPDENRRGGTGGSTDASMDAFVALHPDEPLVVGWDAPMNVDDLEVLETVVSRMTYLGRAESQCEVRLATESDRRLADWNCTPLPDESDDVTRLLASDGPIDIAAVTRRPTDIRRNLNMVQPPGTRHVAYPKLHPVEEPTRRRPAPPNAPTAIRWRISGRARPPITASLAMTGVLRRAVLSGIGERSIPALAGRDLNGEPLRGHGHAHFLALPGQNPKFVEDLILWIPGGIDDASLSCAARVDGLRGHGHLSDFIPCDLGMADIGSIELIAPELTGTSASWTSLTPFSPPRHKKRNQDWGRYLQTQVDEELLRRGFQATATVTLVAGSWLKWRRHKIARETLRDARPVYGLSLTFDEPVGGPLCLGALSHLGLGLFRPT